MAATLDQKAGGGDLPQMPQKKYKKKKKPEVEEPKTPTSKKKIVKKGVIEIDGKLYAVDENGHPTKKLRKKNKSVSPERPLVEERGRRTVGADGKIRRSKSMGRSAQDDERGRRMSAGKPIRRSRSVASAKKTWIDLKGRTHILDEDGSEIIIDKNGKKMRKKKKEPPAPPPPLLPKPDLAISEGIGDVSGDQEGFFDKLWEDDGDNLKIPTSPSKRKEGMASSSGGDLSAKISEVGKENQELQVKLQQAEECIANMSDQNRKEKSKNFKVTAEMMQLKADYTEAYSEVQQLRKKVKDLEATISEKNTEITEMRNGGQDNTPESPVGGWRARHDIGREEKKIEGKCTACGRESNAEVDDLLAENRALNRKLEFEKQSREADLKRKDDKLVFVTNEVKSLHEEIELLIRGDKPGVKPNPTMVRLLNDKKALQTKYNQEKEVMQIRLEGLQEMVDSLEKINEDLKKQLQSEGIQPISGISGHGISGHESGDLSIDLNDMIRGGTNDRASNPKRSAPDLNRSISGLWTTFNKK